MDEKEMSSLEEQYKNLLDVSEDEEVFWAATLKMNKIMCEIVEVQDMLAEKGIDTYEALVRLSILLSAVGPVESKIRKQL